MFFRVAIFVGLGSVVATIIYLTPVPEQTFLSCDRPCHHLDWPMICRVKLTLEVFHSLSKSCGDCPENKTACLADHCVSADGFRRGILSANRQLPGPSIQVCENDILVVDVVNRLPGKTASVHWGGQSQIESPFMDGVPLITQCPIPSYTTFQYKFRASSPGTHLWRAHSASDMTNGIFGSLIVRQADMLEPHRSLYDIDDPNHVVLISPWHHAIVTEGASTRMQRKAAILLVNGRGRQTDGPETPLTTFNVIPGRRHRLRIAHAGGAGSCAVTLTVDEHPLLLISLDGQPITPREVSTITLSKGERADVVLRANKPISSYLMSFHTSKDCSATPIFGSAILEYKGSPVSDLAAVENSVKEASGQEGPKKMHMSTNPVEKCGAPGAFCVTEVKALKQLSAPLNNRNVETTIYLPINERLESIDFKGDGEAETRILSVDNATFTYPSSPLLTQGPEVPDDVFCPPELLENGAGSSTASCKRVEINGKSDPTLPCECVHVRRVPLGSTVEIILHDQAGLDDLVYHLHGYKFHVVAARKFGHFRSSKDLKEMNERGSLFVRNLESPPLKDTIVMPKFGAVAIRFKANNPGYWMLRDEHALEWTRGLDVVLRVGESGDLVSPPQDFPKCGSFVGPDYFLI
ncbi:laccase-4-like isoform X2 [Venturia canescens]|uniref:laccase-4-like isoform X2 n=1 Tax=Venturia canescens TaxID=32260 RepID=UPI001C9C3224|nr:laccase-4-like isoform X2 [Venturia canescens]